MTLTTLRKNFHSLIDRVQDKELLDRFYKALSHTAKNKPGELWNSLDDKEKRILIKSYNESLDRKNLVSHEKVMQKYSKWLTK